MCDEAWRIVINGNIPINLSTPEVVEDECTKKLHNSLLDQASDILLNNINTIYCGLYQIEFSIRTGDYWRNIAMKPDLYVLYKTKNVGLVNIVVEVTTRPKQLIPVEWITAYNLGAYLKNLRPTITMIITPNTTYIAPLTDKSVKRLINLINYPPNKNPKPFICSNCDLRTVCHNPKS